MLETSAFEFLYGDQFTLSTQLLNPNFCVLLSHQHSTTVCLETNPFVGSILLMCTV